MVIISGMSSWPALAERKFGVTLSEDQIKQFKTYLALLLEWNEKFNLTAIRETAEIERKHFLDSLSLAAFWEKDEPPASLIDIGTGAGFPGLPLKIIWPEMKLCLVDSVGKKTNFCRLVADQLGLDGVEVLNKRAEEIGQDPNYREKFQLVTARAVAAMPVLLEYTLPLAKPGGVLMLQKGQSGLEEAEASRNIIRRLGGDLKSVPSVEIPDVEGQRYLVIIDKNAHTPKTYPRRTGVPAKSPLQSSE